MVSRKILSKSNYRLFKSCCFARFFNTEPIDNAVGQVEEIKIPVPWGHVAGKWWGPKSKIPVFCFHGWQDNANSFDTLIPLLSPDYSYLALDLPGHGFSSHLPKGQFYKSNEFVGLIRRIQDQFNWPRVSIIGHSFGAGLGFLFSSFFPKFIDFFVGIDLLKPVSWQPSKDYGKISKIMEKMLIHDSFDPRMAPLYEKSVLVEKSIKGSRDSLTPKSSEILLERGTKEVKPGFFRLTRDCRLRTMLPVGFDQEEYLHLANEITCNVLFLKASKATHYESEDNVSAVMNTIRKKAKLFEYHELDGTHHLHLNTPEIVAPVINSFIGSLQGHRPSTRDPSS